VEDNVVIIPVKPGLIDFSFVVEFCAYRITDL